MKGEEGGASRFSPRVGVGAGEEGGGLGTTGVGRGRGNEGGGGCRVCGVFCVVYVVWCGGWARWKRKWGKRSEIRRNQISFFLRPQPNHTARLAFFFSPFRPCGFFFPSLLQYHALILRLVFLPSYTTPPPPPPPPSPSSFLEKGLPGSSLAFSSSACICSSSLVGSPCAFCCWSNWCGVLCGRGY